MSDPLPIVARLRDLAVDEAKRALAADRLRTLDAAIAAETDAASDPAGDDRSVEDFAAWLRRIAVDRAEAAAALAAAETRSAETRAVLAASRTAARAMEALIEQRDEDRRAVSDRREQAVLDEAGATRHGRN